MMSANSRLVRPWRPAVEPGGDLRPDPVAALTVVVSCLADRALVTDDEIVVLLLSSRRLAARLVLSRP